MPASDDSLAISVREAHVNVALSKRAVDPSLRIDDFRRRTAVAYFSVSSSRRNSSTRSRETLLWITLVIISANWSMGCFSTEKKLSAVIALKAVGWRHTLLC